VWVSRNEGTLATAFSLPVVPLEKITAGATRNWSAGDVTVSYWQSAIGSSQLAEANYWNGHGLDAGGNLYFGKWLIYGGVSLYSAGDIASLSRTAETSLTGSFLVTWKPDWGPSLTAGLSSYRYGYTTFEYDSFTGNALERYEFAAD